ncbi:MAG: tubulin-like doman-containing protein, partial [Prevotellaceae bacterium]|nr:tubulin-like doman-containing protein [Prevotellaceae bacterium]
NGRLAVVIHAPAIVSAIESSIDRIRNHGVIISDKYELDIDSKKDDIHLIFSLCGGTGSGTFIDIAYIIKNVAGRDSINLVGYAVLPDVFTTMVRTGVAMSKVKSNALGAIKDLDYLMHLDPSSSEIELKYSGKIIKTNDMPFSAVNFIDNKNESNITYEHVHQLSEMIALTLFTSSGKIADKVSSVNDNVEKVISEGTLDVENKRAWVSAIGACEIVFKGYELANMYARKAAVRIIDRMFDSSCNDANSIANNWIDSPEINIRENNGPENDNLINQICDKEPKFTIGDVGTDQPLADIRTYYSQVIPTETELNKTIDRISKNVTAGLHDLVIKQINKEECSVAVTLLTLEDILRQIEVFAGEMTAEAEDLRNLLPVLENDVKVGIENLQYWTKKSWLVPGRSRHIDDENKNIADAVYKVALSQIEIRRRDSANKIFTALKNTIGDEHEKINNIKKTLQNVRQELSNEVINIQNDVEKRSAVFEIDLSKGIDTPINNQSIIIKEFIDSLPTKNLYDLDNSQTTLEALLNYTKTLPDAKKWKEKTIDSVLENYTEEEFKDLIRIATEKAKPLLKINGKGYTVANGKVLEQAINKYYYVGLPDVGSSRFTKDNAFKKLQPADMDVNFITTGRNDRIILYRQEGVVPAFAINPLESYHYEYDNCTTFSGFDANLYEKMMEEEFNLLPKAKSDDDIEYWVKGFIFGFIKYAEKKYWYQDWKNGKALKDYWISTGEATRDKAYEKFKRNISPLRKQYTDKIEERINADGKVATQKLIEKVRNNYFDEFAQCEVNKDTIQKRGYEKIAALIEEELQYVESKLTASL